MQSGTLRVPSMTQSVITGVPTLRVGMQSGTLRVPSMTQSVITGVPTQSVGTISNSPASSLAEFAQLVRLHHPHAILFFQRQAPHGAGQFADFNTVVLARDKP